MEQTIKRQTTEELSAQLERLRNRHASTAHQYRVLKETQDHQRGQLARMPSLIVLGDATETDKAELETAYAMTCAALVDALAVRKAEEEAIPVLEARLARTQELDHSKGRLADLVAYRDALNEALRLVEPLASPRDVITRIGGGWWRSGYRAGHVLTKLDAITEALQGDIPKVEREIEEAHARLKEAAWHEA